ncbi:YbeD family protein [Methyloprofundus sp.]|uniref:YbeD family protein n=1 Tax=Methyloprofundus sp. TaxID=2020875 RepID=UPI003D0EA736
MTELEHESPFDFPCQFPIKAMGKNIPDLDAIIVELVRRHVEDLTEGAVKTRLSKGGNFIAITVEIEAQSKAQLDAIYTDLNACPHITMTL